MKQDNSPSLGRSLILGFLAACCMKFLLFDFMIAEGRSMLPAIKPGTILLVNRVAYGFRLPGADTYLIRWSSPKTGEVVVFSTPLGDTAVKRCGALSETRFFAEGDNEGESFDSRSYGTIPIDRILGKVLGIK